METLSFHYTIRYAAIFRNQTKGYMARSPCRGALSDYVQAALRPPYSLSQHTPTPPSFVSAVNFVSVYFPLVFRQFRARQFSRIANFDRPHGDLDRNWNNMRPAELKNLRSIRVLFLSPLMNSFGLKKQNGRKGKFPGVLLSVR